MFQNLNILLKFVLSFFVIFVCFFAYPQTFNFHSSCVQNLPKKLFWCTFFSLTIVWKKIFFFLISRRYILSLKLLERFLWFTIALLWFQSIYKFLSFFDSTSLNSAYFNLWLVAFCVILRLYFIGGLPRNNGTSFVKILSVKKNRNNFWITAFPLSLCQTALKIDER